MNLFIRECKSNIKTFSFWCIGIIFLIIASAGKTTSMVGQSDAGVNELLEQLPKSVQTVFGVGVVDYSTAIGVFAIVFTYIALIAAFQLPWVSPSSEKKNGIRHLNFCMLSHVPEIPSWLISSAVHSASCFY